MNIVKLKAYAKINLGLDVLRKREDGYHEVRMIMQTINLYDKISINATNNSSIKIRTNLQYLPTDSNNLVYKAAALIKNKYQIKEGVFIHLEKKIPVAAGMAGGSADAASTLYGMKQLFQLEISQEELMKMALQLGADVPYCIMRGTALSEGIGETLTPLPPFPSCHILIVKPFINVSTKYVYEHLKLDNITKHPDIDGIIHQIEEKNLIGATKLFGNVLESVTEAEHPIISEIKEKMLSLGALTALMSGSGPTVFGVFDNVKVAEKAFYDFKISNISKQVYLTTLFQPSIKPMA